MEIRLIPPNMRMRFLFATEREAKPFREACPTARIEICGVGAAEFGASLARILATSIPDDEMLILAGIAGSYSLDDVALCEVVEVSSEEIASLPSQFSTCYCMCAQTDLRRVTSNSVNHSIEEKVASCLPQIENMEGATFFAMCQAFNVRFLEVRAISNRVGDPFKEWCMDDALAALTAEISTLVKS